MAYSVPATGLECCQRELSPGTQYSAERRRRRYVRLPRISEILAAAGMPLDQVVVSGASAGGHLALLVGMRNGKGEHPCGAHAASHSC